MIALLNFTSKITVFVPRYSETLAPYQIFKLKARLELGLPQEVKIAINQGSGMNIDRGLEEAVAAVSGMEGWLLLLVGSGDAIPKLQTLVRQKGLNEKVRFIPVCRTRNCSNTPR